MSTVYRLATVDDVDDICAIEDAIFSKPADRLGRRQIVHLLTKGHGEIYLDVFNGRPVGFAIVLFRTGTRVVRGYSIAILPDVQRTGLATAFFDWAEARWIELGYDRASIEVHTTNEGAQRLYERLGYHVTERMPDYFGDGDDAVRMVKDLTQH